MSARADPERIRGLYAIADDDPRWKRDPLEQGRAALAGGARLLQLRVKHATDRQALAWARALREHAGAHGALFFVNDRFDLALAADADGVHLGQEDLPPGRLPASVRARLLVGRSTHTLEQLEAALAEDVDYVAFGPVFGTASKASPYAARGLAALREAARRAAPRPLVAIGGITLDRAADAIAAGAHALALISALAAAPNPEHCARAFVERIARVTLQASQPNRTTNS